MRANNWLYHYYMVQSRLQYNLAYGGQPSTIAALYPQMMHMITPPFAPGFGGDGCGSMPVPAHDHYTPNGTGYGSAADAYGFNSFARYHDGIKEKDFRYYGHAQHHPRSPPIDSRSESSSPVTNSYHHYDPNGVAGSVAGAGEDFGGYLHGARRGLYPDPGQVGHYKSKSNSPDFVHSDPEDDNNNCDNTKASRAKK